MKKKSSQKIEKLKINSLEGNLFKKLTDEELKEIKGGDGLEGLIKDFTLPFPLTPGTCIREC